MARPEFATLNFDPGPVRVLSQDGNWQFTVAVCLFLVSGRVKRLGLPPSGLWLGLPEFLKGPNAVSYMNIQNMT